MKGKHSNTLPILAALLLLAIPPTVYIGCYYWRSTLTEYGAGNVRDYPTEWEATVFKPGAKVESFIARTPTHTWSFGELEIDPPNTRLSVRRLGE